MRLLDAVVAVLLATSASAADRFDVVIRGGRVMDPETGRDAVLDVGITSDRIAKIGGGPLAGARVLEAAGLVVAPGFIDLHQHTQDAENDRLKALDGVTTALEMEIGSANVAAFLKARTGSALIHFGTTASHPGARRVAWGVSGDGLPIGPGRHTGDPSSPEQLASTLKHLASELDAGGLGIGMGLAYTPGATRHEVIETFRLAAARHLPVFTHVRSAGRKKRWAR